MNSNTQEVQKDLIVVNASNQPKSNSQSCCAPAKQEVCCEPSAKASCCGETSTTGSCGCK